MIILIIAALVFIIIFLALLIRGSSSHTEFDDDNQVIALAEYLEQRKLKEKMRAAAKSKKHFTKEDK